MKLDEIVAWYQKKIGTYDKQQWEKSVEQKILDGFSSITLKTAKLKTELIDVDLVRGSTFPKAKPKQTLFTVIRLAILRYFLLPLYAQWWVRQTSPNIFALLLVIYITQMFNWAIYSYNGHRTYITMDSSSSNISHLNGTHSKPVELLEEHIVSLTELLIPMGLGLLLSLIHSQIVATNTVSGSVKATKRRSFSNASQSGKQIKAESRLRRRRKPLNRMRSQEYADKLEQRKLPNLFKKLNTTQQLPPPQSSNNSLLSLNAASSANIEAVEEIFNGRATLNNGQKYMDLNKTMPLANVATKQELVDINEQGQQGQQLLQHQQHRSVNWPSKLQSYVVETKEQAQQTSADQSTTASENSSPNAAGELNKQIVAGSSSSNSCAVSPSKQVRIDDSVQEFYDELLSNSEELPAMPNRTIHQNDNGALRRPIGDDDGFESLNGKSSSGEETIAHSLLNSAITDDTPARNQLRQRLNLSSAHQHSESVKKESKLTYIFRQRKSQLAADSDLDKTNSLSSLNTISADVPFQKSKKTQVLENNVSSDETDEDGDDGEIISSPTALNNSYTECTTSATEWLGVTTNSEEYSYSSELEQSDEYRQHALTDENDLEFAPTTILNPHGSSDRISCAIWDQQEIKKAQLSVLEISSRIIERVEAMQEASDYIYIGIVFSILLSLLPIFCRLCEASVDANKQAEIDYLNMPMLLWEKSACSIYTLFSFAFGETKWERTVLIISFLQRICLTNILFLIFVVAERTFKQRFLYAKLFSRLTSARRARKSNLPHFRLNKVRNIKTWLSVRSYLKKRGPQRSVDVIVSAAFIVTLLLLAFLSIEWLRDLVHLHSHLNMEALLWSSCIGVFLLRFMTLGTGIHNKYRSISVLITEQINLYLQIEQKPKKKDELMVANSVLKLAADLLKELETPFKISGLSANPYLFTTIKVVILSALSGVLSEMLGFKLKLHKIKIK